MQMSRALTGVVVVLALLFGGWFTLRSDPENTLTITFQARSGGDTLVFDEFVYANPGGDGEYRLRDFRFYLSNVHLIGDSKTFAEPNSYHLIRFDNSDRAHSLTFAGLPLRSVEKVRFMIGLDAEANSSIEFRGDLDPNSQMAWNWEVGYKFMVFEGGLLSDGEVIPLVYHVGFTENGRMLEFFIPAGLVLQDDAELRFDVDVAKLFDGQTIIDMAATQSVKFDREDAKMLADNYANMIEMAF